MVVDEPTLINFKRRYQMRLQLLKTPLDATCEEAEAVKRGLEKLTNGFIKKSELDSILTVLEQGVAPINDNIDEMIQELEGLESATWKELSEFQERFFSFNILAYQQSLDFQQNLNSALQQVLTTAVKKPKAPQKKSTPTKLLAKVEEPVMKYSTPALQAMSAAIKEFWLEYDVQQPPTQKQVSNFIAEQIGEPIRNRFTDELARAIKSENI